MTIEVIKAALEKAQAEAQEANKELRGEIEKNAKLNTEMQTKAAEMDKRVFELEKQLADATKGLTSPENQPSERENVAKALIDNFANGFAKANIDLKKAVTSADDSAGPGIFPQRLPGIITPGQQRFMIRDLLADGTTTSSSIEYVRENAFTNNAATVPENTLKPESNLTLSNETANVRTIAHWITASNQIVDDMPMLQSYLGNRLMYGLKLVEEAQILNGGGTGQDLLGVNSVATAYDTDLDADVSNLADKIAMAIYQVSLSNYPASGIVLNTRDWFRLCLLKDANGNYLMGGPQAFASQVLWGLPVVATVSQAQGTFTLGAFDLASQLWDRQQANVQITPYNADNFVKNMVTILVEERLALAHYRPAAIVKGSLSTSGS